MSNLFPIERSLEITSDVLPLTQTGSIQVYVQLAEDKLFVQGFEPHEYEERPPSLLRGSLVIRVIKPSKIKNITLTFKGTARTEWPEGIPPKRQDFTEENTIVTHTWPFYSHSNDTHSSGADIVKATNHHDLITAQEDVSSLNLDNASIKSSSNALSMLKRVASPSPNRARSSSIKSAFAFTNLSNDHQSSNGNDPFVFQPGDYVYNFEHPVPASGPETIDATFGSVTYQLSVFIERIGAFKSNIATSLPVKIIRSPSDESIEDSEPIAISRDWEDQLHYDIIIASKAMILNAYLPIAFKLIPLDKIKLHRIRIYLTENLEYYCRNKKVHRMEPTKKYLLLEHKAPPPPDLPPDADAKQKKMGNLLTSDGHDITAKEFEFQVYVPQKLNNRQQLHPNTSYVNIKSHHWIKICLRLSRLIDGKPKHYEISIDSPIHVLDPSCSHANTLLPAYGIPSFDSAHQNHESNIYFPKDIVNSPPLSPEVEAVDSHLNSMYLALNSTVHNPRSRSTSTIGNRSLSNFETSLSANVYKPNQSDLQPELTSPQAVPVSPVVSPLQRPIHLLRRPSFEPPPFDADISPPPLMRDPYGSIDNGIDSAIFNANSSSQPPKDPPTYADYLEEEAKSPRLDSSNNPNIVLTEPTTLEEPHKESDLADNFQFRGISPNMPESVIRATSPEAQRLRAGTRGNLSSAASSRSSIDHQRSKIDDLLSDDEGDIVDHGGVSSYQPRRLSYVDNSNNDPNEDDDDDVDEREGRRRLSSRSSASPGSIAPLKVNSDDDFEGREPLLYTTNTSNSLNLSTYSLDQNPRYRDRFESKESIAIRREPSSVDITALYQNSGNPFLARVFTDEPKRPTLSRRQSSIQSITPVLSILDDVNVANTIEEEDVESSKSKSENSSLKANHSSSTLTSGGGITPALQDHKEVSRNEIESTTKLAIGTSDLND